LCFRRPLHGLSRLLVSYPALTHGALCRRPLHGLKSELFFVTFNFQRTLADGIVLTKQRPNYKKQIKFRTASAKAKRMIDYLKHLAKAFIDLDFYPSAKVDGNSQKPYKSQKRINNRRTKQKRKRRNKLKIKRFERFGGLQRKFVMNPTRNAAQNQCRNH
jgi:hypothetical protein